MQNCYLGIDVGSVSTNVVLMNEKKEIVGKVYTKTQGKPIDAIQRGLKEIKSKIKEDIKVKGVGATGSGRHLASMIVGGDIVKNEITAHGIAALNFVDGVKTIIEIGGQDSKIILLRDGIISDFAMNTVCAAGTGSFLDRQASRMGIEIENFGELALQSKNSVRIAGRCAVFAESDMIHKQQLGHNQEDIIKGLCDALVRNFLNNLAKGKEVLGPVVFQGGVAANVGIKKSFEEALGLEVFVPPHHEVMGAIGCCLLAKENAVKNPKTNFKGFDIIHSGYNVKGIECQDCSNLCEVIEILRDGTVMARWGDKCGKWNSALKSDIEKLA
ncbi:activator of (R)-2-hydroxyglutaryl-CoA dehydratase HgdC [Clostridium aceticum]|uniref:Activator of (R)-2-hydroxyglutaryl-CoA dehydratase HgdC n=2 Tax=Clostridium aceticum TaxID=84022 RepID=A0A0D8IEX8_9CLOT|nr:acyl-CoA dehydratase activase [Clostridium aceticum]AKL94098.1 activator of (R)-2-hydroxyglutaryl-CoA dehydratase HgdC [Clostridium aceticum]KJF28542.1 2-hydroxyglutaryl-CoA dehydratase [Clostridium aceticum]